MFFATGSPGWLRFGGNAAAASEPVPETEAQALQSQAAVLQSELDAVKNRLSEISTKTTKDDNC
jgi:hypothetical protein